MLYHTAPWFDDADDESAIDANAVAATNEEKGCFPFSCLSPWPGPRSLACEAYKTEVVPEPVPLATWSDADGDDDDYEEGRSSTHPPRWPRDYPGNEAKGCSPFSCFSSKWVPRPLRPGR